MSQNLFAPKLNDTPQTTTPGVQLPATSDATSGMLLLGMRSVVVGFAFLLPIFFLPGIWSALGFQKVLLALVAIVIVVIIGSLLMLRTREVKTALPISLLGFVALTAVAYASALWSPDSTLAIRGSVIGVQTVLFLLVMLGVSILPLVLQNAKRFTLLTLTAFGSGLGLLLAYVVLRLFAGPVLSLGSFPAVTQAPAGNFNDLALLAGLTVIAIVITLLQLPLKIVAKVALSVTAVLALIVLAVVNFFYVWLVVGFFGLLVLLYLLSRDMLFTAAAETSSIKSSRTVTALAAIICVVSAVFIVAGDYAGQAASSWFEVEYLEVRPSFEATTDIARAVYQDNWLLGTGPNQFADAWRQYKDPSINQTLFWNTNFVAGSGLVPTMFVTLGLLGGLAVVAFHILYVWSGVRSLVRPTLINPFWYFVGVLSFAGSLFLWLMSYVYVPGATVLLIAAFLTGLSLVAFSGLQPQSQKTIPLVVNHKRGFVLMAVAILLITSSLFAVYIVGEQYVAQASFNKAQASATTIDEIDQAAMRSYNLYPDDRFLGIRAQVALLELNRLLNVSEPTNTDRDRFLEVGSLALQFAQAATQAAPQNPEYRAILAGIYNNFAVAGEPQALALATSSLAEATRLDPLNPTYALIEAQMAASRGDAALTRSALESALSKKRNFTEALYLLAQLDIAEGNTESAIDVTRAIITLEPRNPTRYYQLGILLTANNQVPEAAQAYQAALTLDPGYANARYLFALLLLDQGQSEQALAELRTVAETNVENQQLQAVIAAIESGDIPQTATGTIPVAEAAPENDGPGVTSTVAPDTDLITPLNTLPAGDTQAEAPATTEPEAQAEGGTEPADQQ